MAGGGGRADRERDEGRLLEYLWVGREGGSEGGGRKEEGREDVEREGTGRDRREGSERG